ncbi:MAG: hypothetical protein WC717_03410 [Candidatus Micrarchaeia archaeon]|jgi:hypothetical protein
MQGTIPLQQQASADFVGAYEKAMQEVIAGCGSRKAANAMVGELKAHYERTSEALLRAEGNVPKQDALLRLAKADADQIIEKYAPSTGTHFHELVISYSFGAIMLSIPVIAAASLLTAATGIIAAGSAYFISAKILSNWKAMAAKRRISNLSGVVGPKHIKALPSMVRSLKKP